MADHPHYAIMRIGKIHNYNVLETVEAHNIRKIPVGTVPGAPVPTDWVDKPGTLSERARKVLQEMGAEWEEGKILAVEFMVTASPEWWANASTEQKTDWIMAQWKFANDKFGGGLISFTPHVDESTPHVQFVGLPLYSAIERKRGRKPSSPEGIARRAKEEAEAPKVWRLSFHEMFGGHSDRLADLQTEYHGYVAHLGLERGKDTRGLQIRHTTLKEYKVKLQKEERELFRQQRELAAEADRLDEERQALEFYDQQIDEGFSKLEAARQEFHKDELEHFAQTEEFRVREEILAEQEADLAGRIAAHEKAATALEKRTEELEEREAELLVRQAQADAAEIAQAAERSRLDSEAGALNEREAAIDEREQAVGTRETDVIDKETEVTARERRIETIIVQVGIFCRIILGSVKATWNDEADQPDVLNPEAMTTEEAEALKQPVPDLLKPAMRVAIGFAKRRQKAKSAIKRAISVVRSHRSDAREKLAEATQAEVSAKKLEDEANNKLLDADRRTRTAEEREAKADQAAKDGLLSIEQRRRTAENDLEQIEAKTRLADDARLTAERARVSKERLLQEAIRARRAEETQRDAAVAEAANLRKEIDESRAELATIKLERKALEEERAALDLERSELDRRQEETAKQQERMDASEKIYRHIVEHQLEVTIGDQTIAWQLSGSQNDDKAGSASVGDVDPQTIELLKKYQKLLEYEAVTVGARIAVNKLHMELKGKREEIAKLHPNEQPKLRGETLAESERIRALEAAYKEAGLGR